ncbi:MAG: hypothetical protein KatS3mg076_3277 [Candidatus Binatia bacterium]|nr:MAG: hypothetical protein KatS3mg076_3277 [Candidatus Binatia bacterium]
MSLRLRIACAFALLETLALAALFLWLSSSLIDSTRRQLETRETAILETLARLGREHLARDGAGTEVLRSTARELARKTSVRRVLFLDARGRVVASDRPEEIGMEAPAFYVRGRDPWRVRELREGGRVLGTIAIRFSRSAVEEAREQARWVAFTIGGAGILLTIVVGLAVGQFASRRIEKVVAAAEKVARGEIASSGVRGRDEIGRLGEAFDLMADAVRYAVASLRETSDRYRMLFEDSPVGIAIHDGETLLLANAALARMAGVPNPEELVGRPVLSLAHPKSWPVIRERLGRVLTEGVQVPLLELTLQRPDGGIVEAQVTSGPVVFGGRKAVLTVLKDITEHKRALAEKERLEKELALRERMAAVGSLVGRVAHEIRNPLFGISATLDALEVAATSGQALRNHLDVLRREIARLETLVAELLEYGRPESSEREPGSPADVLHEAVASCAELARRSGVEITLEVDEGLPTIPMDRTRLVQLFRNLVDNAVRHSPEGGSVEVRAFLDSSGVACVVRDRGTGIAPDDLPHVFEPFFSRRAGGTGLGLAIAKKIADAHGASIELRNLPEGGVEARVVFPERPPDGIP